jgi:hypothetical protein
MDLLISLIFSDPRNFSSSSQFGKSIVWEFEKIKEILFFAASWGISNGWRTVQYYCMTKCFVSDFLRY